MGVIAPNGCGLQAFWEACINGRSGVDAIQSFDTSAYEVHIGGEASDFNRADYMERAIYRKIERFAQFAVASTKMAIDDASFSLDDYEADRVGVVIGSGLGGLLFSCKQVQRFHEGGPKRVQVQSVPRICPHATTSYVSKVFGFRGINYAVSTACSSGANAIGQGMWMVRHGMLDACIVGGAEESMVDITLAGFQELRALSRRNDEPQKASRPFDKNRDGFVLSEGGAALILEPLDRAIDRGAKIYALLAGFGSNCSGYDMVAPQPDGADAAAAMTAAMADGQISADEIDYVNAHGTSTLFNDVAETKAIKLALGDRAKEVAISSTKSMIGHTNWCGRSYRGRCIHHDN